MFRLATTGLRAIARPTPGAQPLRWNQALAGNLSLWSSVLRMMSDPANTLPAELRTTLISLGKSVELETARPIPDVTFLIAINETVYDSLNRSLSR